MIFRIGALAAAITLGALATGLEAALAPPVHADARAMMLPVHAEKLVAHTSAGEKSFTVEIADEPGEQQRGLMFRGRGTRAASSKPPVKPPMCAP